MSTGGTASTGGVKASGGSGGATGGATTAGTTAPTSACVTSADGAFWKTIELTVAATVNADITVNDTAAGGQTWEGFGGSFNELGWYHLTTQTMKEQALELLFGTDGANFTWGRIPIGASDYAMNRYTLDDPASNNDPTASGETARPAADTSLTNFKIDRDKEKLIPFIQAAQKVKPDLRFWASPWTPPVWMKTGYKSNSGADTSKPAQRPSYYDGGSFNGTTANLNAYAQYYTKWVQAYADEGIKVEYVSPQNEPGYDQNYPSCLWDKTVYLSWVKLLGQAMKAINVKVMLGTLSNAGDGGRNDLDIAAAVLTDASAKPAVSVVGVQWGALERVNSGWSSGGLPIWATEHKAGNYPWQSDYNSVQAPNDQAYAVESWGYIRDAITKGKVTAYNAWNMVLDKSGLGIDTSRDWKQDALLVADAGKVTPTPAYYVFRHFSQFVAPGAKVLTTTGGDAVAFKNPDGSVITVMYNSGAAKPAYVVKIGTKTMQFSMPAAGWATVVSR
jgi:glucosylceramidase